MIKPPFPLSVRLAPREQRNESYELQRPSPTSIFCYSLAIDFAPSMLVSKSTSMPFIATPKPFAPFTPISMPPPQSSIQSILPSTRTTNSLTRTEMRTGTVLGNTRNKGTGSVGKSVAGSGIITETWTETWTETKIRTDTGTKTEIWTATETKTVIPNMGAKNEFRTDTGAGPDTDTGARIERVGTPTGTSSEALSSISTPPTSITDSPYASQLSTSYLVGIPSPTGTLHASEPLNSPHKTTIGLISGLVIGATLILLPLVLLCWRWRKHNAQRLREYIDENTPCPICPLARPSEKRLNRKQLVTSDPMILVTRYTYSSPTSMVWDGKQSENSSGTPTRSYNVQEDSQLAEPQGKERVMHSLVRAPSSLSGTTVEAEDLQDLQVLRSQLNDALCRLAVLEAVEEAPPDYVSYTD
ncbi:hypothetical protein PM082_006661 [Marasmius tenuissimus]|nr:hypothetical protein PM082_006661 [Marasmius tenuissimus]